MLKWLIQIFLAEERERKHEQGQGKNPECDPCEAPKNFFEEVSSGFRRFTAGFHRPPPSHSTTSGFQQQHPMGGNTNANSNTIPAAATPENVYERSGTNNNHPQQEPPKNLLHEVDRGLKKVGQDFEKFGQKVDQSFKDFKNLFKPKKPRRVG